jgi:ABC-type proline/glycine betaine transport system permease subunit
MRAYGSDRVRSAGGKVILHSALPKGWTARTPKSLTHSEFPGTAVLWDDQYYEVITADALPSGGVRYVLDKWLDENTMRVFEAYSAESEERLRRDHETATRQRRHSVLARIAGVALGHLPAHVQERLADNLGLFPARMTLLSTIPSVVLFAVCIWLFAGSKVEMGRSPVPGWLWLFAVIMTVDSGIRFFIAMSQNRGAGSLPGTFLYAIYCLVTGKRPAPPKLQPEPVSPELVRIDSVESRSWMFTLLRPEEQAAIARRYDYDYRKDSYGVAAGLLAVGLVGILSSLPNINSFGGLLSTVVAGALSVEQILRLRAFKQGPAGSVLAVLVRPFVKDVL